MYTNHHALTMNPYFMANPNSMAMAQGMGMGMNMMGTGMQQMGNMSYNGDGFEQSYLNGVQGQEQDQSMQGDMSSNEGGSEMMVI
jgi:hypothetical protein